MVWTLQKRRIATWFDTTLASSVVSLDTCKFMVAYQDLVKNNRQLPEVDKKLNLLVEKDWIN